MASDDVARWLSLLERGLRGNEGEQLREWLKNKAHRARIIDAARLWHGPEILAVISGLVPKAELVIHDPALRRRRFNLILGWGTLGVIGALCVGVTTGFVKLPFDDSRLLAGRGIYATSVGERREVTLPDDTVVTLNTGSRLSVEYSTGSREVYLARGEATFQVTPDAGRPFIVNAGMRRFLATGTRFNVRVLSPQLTELTVTDGKVKVMDAPPRLPETPAQRRATLLYGETTVQALETAQVEPGFQSVSPIDASQVEAMLAWQHDLIIFEDEALQDALTEIDRYTTTKFVLGDEKVRHIRIAGSFRTGDVDGLLLSLRDKFRVDSTRDPQGRIVLSSRSAL
ncbi:MAG: FecR domain-containing protein [Gammaproteobacteria bacterium]